MNFYLANHGTDGNPVLGIHSGHLMKLVRMYTVKEFLDELEPSCVRELKLDDASDGQIYVARAKVKDIIKRIKRVVPPQHMGQDLEDIPDDVADKINELLAELNT